MADVPFTDTHVHFHDFTRAHLRWDWLLPDAEDPVLGDYETLKSHRYIAEDFLSETRFQNVRHVVHVEAALGTLDPVHETTWLQQSYDRTGVPQGLVAAADLASPDVREVLDRHCTHPNLRGIRDLRYDEYLSDEAWLAGFALLDGRGLVFCDDPLLEHMSSLATLAGQFPGMTICIDHAGFPRQAGSSILPGLASRHETVGSSGQHGGQDFRTGNVRPRLDDRLSPSVGRELHRVVGSQPSFLRDKLAG